MNKEPIPVIEENKCPNSECNEWTLVHESMMSVGNISPVGKLEEEEGYDIYRCDKCGGRFKIKK